MFTTFAVSDMNCHYTCNAQARLPASAAEVEFQVHGEAY